MQTRVSVLARVDSKFKLMLSFMLTGATPTWLASLLVVSSQSLQQKISDRGQGKMMTKNGSESGSARIMRKNPTTSPRTTLKSQPVCMNFSLILHYSLYELYSLILYYSLYELYSLILYYSLYEILSHPVLQFV